MVIYLPLATVWRLKLFFFFRQEAKMQAACFHLTAQTEAYQYQEKLSNQLIESLQVKPARLMSVVNAIHH